MEQDDDNVPEIGSLVTGVMPPRALMKDYIEDAAARLHELAHAVGELVELLDDDSGDVPPPRPHADGAARDAEEFRRRLERLTVREREVVEALARGMSNRELARHLGISELTVKNHLHSIFMKLEVADRTQAISRVLRARGMPAARDGDEPPGFDRPRGFRSAY
ncbi:LuxR C-terminal-related transcriptional regulator [Spirillospora sp. NPDC047279]|uniref:helix-turn-helix domain-containing protein n=1 Tax=Spirillospora sp. NPDC047279 TaxID=3155478 RepID=UPI0033E46DEF